MKKFLLTILLVTVAAMTGMAMDIANVRVTTTPVGQRADSPERLPYSSTTCDVLVNENFDEWIEGSTEEPYFDVPMAMLEYGIEIDPEYTHGQQWYGHKVYQAGGALAMRTLSMDQSILNTPRMDYSGSIRITFLTRALKSTWLDEEGKKMEDNSAHLIVGISDEEGRKIQTNARSNLADLQMYADMGWMEVTIEFDNYSAYNGVSIVFAGTRTLLIDDIKISSSSAEFIAVPVVKEVSNVTENSFTVSWEKVRKSYNYYLWLYSYEVDPETGEEKYNLELPKKTLDQIAASDMTVEDYIEAMGGENSNYLNYDIVNRHGELKYTFKDLDPNKDYCFAVMSHNVYQFSEKKLIKVTELPTPTLLSTSDFTSSSFTANWSGVRKADAYSVDLFGVTIVDHSDSEYPLLYEDFDKTSQYSSATDINAATPCTVNMTLEDMTTLPGWELNGPLAMEIPGMGEMPFAYMLDGWFGPGMNMTISTPSIYVANGGYVNVKMHLKCVNQNAPIVLQFAGAMYMADMNGNVDVIAELKLPTNGYEQAKLEMACMDQEGQPLFIDYISVTQPLNEGDMLFTSISSTEVPADQTSFTFNGLDEMPYDVFAYNVTSLKNDGRRSAPTERDIVKFRESKSVVSVEASESDAQEVARYTIDGRLISAPVSGINIIRYSDGTTKKVLVK